MPSNRELEEKILNNPDQRDAYVVYGDFLQSQGDPRGELIALMNKNADDRVVQGYVREHRSPLLGTLAEWVFADDEAPLTLTWFMGFIESAKLRLTYDQYDSGDYQPEQMLETLMAHPSARFIRGLRLGLINHEGENEYDGCIDSLVDAGARSTMRHIHVGDFEYPDETEMSWSGSGECGKLWKLYPNLERATVQSGRISLGEIDLPKLKQFTVKTGGLTQSALQSIASARWPQLEDLEIWFGDRNYGADCTVEALSPILEGHGLGKLSSLGLMNAEFTDEICRALPSSKILKQLQKLDLSKGAMSSDGAKVLADNKERFAHLKRINLEYNYLTETDEDLLRGICAEVHFGEQQTARGERRYVMVGE